MLLGNGPNAHKQLRAVTARAATSGRHGTRCAGATVQARLPRGQRAHPRDRGRPRQGNFSRVGPNLAPWPSTLTEHPYQWPELDAPCQPCAICVAQAHPDGLQVRPCSSSSLWAGYGTQLLATINHRARRRPYPSSPAMRTAARKPWLKRCLTTLLFPLWRRARGPPLSVDMRGGQVVVTAEDGPAACAALADAVRALDWCP
jgi:hypothetical protein